MDLPVSGDQLKHRFNSKRHQQPLGRTNGLGSIVNLGKGSRALGGLPYSNRREQRFRLLSENSLQKTDGLADDRFIGRLRLRDYFRAVAARWPEFAGRRAGWLPWGA
jgi:hypothetical protein